MSTKAELELRLAALKGELASVEGTSTEVYSRIVGYYRAVRNWNAGKREEYARRRAYAMPAEPAAAIPRGATADAAEFWPSSSALAPAASRAPSAAVQAAPERSGILVFTRATCPNCPPVADFVGRSGLPAVFVDVEKEEGLALARRHKVLSTPTVVGIDSSGAESFRAHGLAELKAALGKAAGLPAAN